MKKQEQLPLTIKDKTIKLSLERDDTSRVNENQAVKEGKCSYNHADPCKSKKPMQSPGINNELNSIRKDAEMIGTEEAALSNEMNRFDSESRVKICKTKNDRNDGEGSSERTHTKKSVGYHCANRQGAISAQWPMKVYAESNASIPCASESGNQKGGEWFGKQQISMTMTDCSIGADSYGDEGLKNREAHCETKVKGRRRQSMFGKDNLVTLSEISESEENTIGENKAFVKNEEFSGKNSEKCYESQKELKGKRFKHFPSLPQSLKLEMECEGAKAKEKQSLEPSLGGTIRAEEKSQRRYQDRREIGQAGGENGSRSEVQKEEKIGKKSDKSWSLVEPKSTSENMNKIKGTQREILTSMDEKRSVWEKNERDGFLQRDKKLERKISSTEQQLHEEHDIRRLAKNQKQEGNESYEESRQLKEKRVTEKKKTGEESTLLASRLERRQSQYIEKLSCDVIESSEEKTKNVNGDNGGKDNMNLKKVTETFPGNSEIEIKRGSCTSASHDLTAFKNPRKISRVCQTPIRAHNAQLVVDFPSGIRSRLNTKGTRKLSTISVSNDIRSMTPRTKKLHQMSLENTIAFKYSERPFGCLACHNCCFRSQTQEEQASHHSNRHLTQLPYFCKACFDNGVKSAFRIREELEQHIIGSEHNMFQKPEPKS